MQRVMRFQPTPLWTVNRILEPSAILTRNKTGLHAVPWNENRQKKCPSSKPALKVELTPENDPTLSGTTPKRKNNRNIEGRRGEGSSSASCRRLCWNVEYLAT